MKVGDVVRIKWPRKDEKDSLGIIMSLKGGLLIAQRHAKVMMYHWHGKEQRYLGEDRLERVS